MGERQFETELLRYGPEVDYPREAIDEARAYCRQLAASHYENFTVASWMLPRNLRQHFCNIYAYCRWSDDLADEVASPDESLLLLDWWRGQLSGCFAGEVRHPVFVALRDTIHEFAIPQQPLAALLDAFERDQQQDRYATHAELLDYCRCSANPVGHLVLYLGRCYDEQTVSLSDAVCTGLQLANFLQDVGEDFNRGRIYIPQDVCVEFDYDQECFQGRVVDDRWRSMMASEVERAARYLNCGWPLVDAMPKELRLQIELFIRGGLAILQAIRDAEYDVWTVRPRVGKLSQLKIAITSWLRQRVIGGRAVRDQG